MSKLEKLEERIELLEGSLTVGSPAEENLAELVSIVRGILEATSYSYENLLRMEERNAK